MENRLRNLPKLSELLFPGNCELLPNTTELFELEFALCEYKFLTKDEIIHRGAFFKSVDGVPTHHYMICSNNSSLIWEGRSEITKSYFKEGNFSTGYATHGLFPYRGKFHPQLIKGILNILNIQLNEKFNTVISKNTFYFYNEKYEAHIERCISLIAQNIFIVGNNVKRIKG